MGGRSEARDGEGRRRLSGLLLVSVVGALLASAAPTEAQVTRPDSAAVLFRAATELQADGRDEAADALLRHIVERYGDTPAADRARVLLSEAGRRREAGSGRTELQVWSTTFGLWLGVAVPAAFGADDTEPYGLGLLLGGPAGFFGGRAYGRRLEVTEGQARAITLGGTWGTWQGFGWAEVLDLGEEEICPPPGEPGRCFEGGQSEEEQFAAMVVGGLAGVVTGALLARSPVSEGTATSAHFGSLWGSWIGFATGFLGDLEDDDLMATTLVGGNLGLVGGALGGSRMEMSRSRARIVSVAGLVGGLAGAGLDLIVQPDDEKVAIAIPLAGSILGLGAGFLSTRDHDLRGQSGAGPGEAFGALVDVRDGRVGLGAPLPYPTLVRGETVRGPVWRTGLGLTLLRASF